jgi:hypothetical protein
MAKKNRAKTRVAESAVPGEVGPRQPCPCGSGKRYKACHGAPGGGTVYVKRPFEGLASECDLVALRELVPAATAVLPLTGEHGDRSVRVCTMLPMAAPAMVRDSGEVWLGLQVQHDFGDPSRDLAAVLLAALEAEPGTPMVGLTEAPGAGPRLQDLVADEALEVEVHEGFDFWVDDPASLDAQSRESLERANASAVPTERLTSVEAAYWCRIGDRTHLRWAMPHDEDALLDAIARLHAAGQSGLGDGSRYIGAFRALGVLVPVWDLPTGSTAADAEDPAAAFAERLAEALQRKESLTYEERRARAGVVSRQLTLR